MQDILVYLFQFAESELKQSLLLVNKELSKLRFKDFIEDDVSQHILKHKGYLNIELYNKIQDRIKFIQQYKRGFNITSKKLDLFYTNIKELNLIGLVNLKILIINSCDLESINLTGLINLEILDLGYNYLKDIDLTGLINLQYLDITNNKLQKIDLINLINLKK